MAAVTQCGPLTMKLLDFREKFLLAIEYGLSQTHGDSPMNLLDKPTELGSNTCWTFLSEPVGQNKEMIC